MGTKRDICTTLKKGKKMFNIAEILPWLRRAAFFRLPSTPQNLSKNRLIAVTTQVLVQTMLNNGIRELRLYKIYFIVASAAFLLTVSSALQPFSQRFSARPTQSSPDGTLAAQRASAPVASRSAS